MRNPILLLSYTFLLTIFQMNTSVAQFIFPKTDEIPVVDSLHGFQLTDPYRWLEDKTDPKVIRWTKAQHEASVDYLNELCPEIEGLRDELKAYIDRDIISPMQLVADRQFFTLRKQGEKQSKLYTRLEGKDVLLFDPEQIDPSGKSSMTGRSFTEKADRVAVGLQTKGAEINTYYIIDTKSGQILGAPIEGLRGFSWTKDEQHAYIWVGTQEMINAQKPVEVRLHRLGESRDKDVTLLVPDDAKNFASVFDTRFSDLTFYSEGDFYATHALRMKKIGSNDTPVEIYASKEFRASPYANGDRIYFYTNHEAPNFKLMLADKKQAGFKNWKTLIPEKKDVVLENYTVTPKYLLLQEKKDVLSRLMLHDLNGKFIRELKLPELGNVSFVNYNHDVDAVFVGLSTFTSPSKIYRLAPDQLESKNLNWELFYSEEIPIDTDNIEARIEFYTSKDGTKVPIFIVHKKGLELNGNNPTLLYGYGGFNSGIAPAFIGSRAMFINRGGVFAEAGIRGGDEYGESWHQDGMLFKKQNTFDDFITAAEFLIDQGYTNTDKLAVEGGSNGGLLIGAVTTQRPDLFKTAICAVPLLDMIRYHRFLIARYWIPEYGDPDKKEDFQNLLTYSPYHNIRQGINLPTMLVTAGENDSRVDPLHAKKFVAALQNNPGQHNPVLLYMNFDSGHGTGQSTEQLIDNFEFRYRFLMCQLGMVEQGR
ncbi:MAG TPA: prolyl oligopeptidase family serine peptidase [Saprospiraceae bacterium]|nr:prolyl oligopeptidase family serine peptidase [Saprospiraceae bacterium]HMQ82623.1 prolyl oligopeptidase family serine peptidase [Saprospiraceae bacterium]